MTDVKNFKINRCENGLTLIEVLASVVILSIVLISFSSILLQSVKHTKYNEEKLTAVDIAEEIVGKIRNGESITSINLTKPFKGFTHKAECVDKVDDIDLYRVEITVESDSSVSQKKSPFMTEVYIEEDGACPS